MAGCYYDGAGNNTNCYELYNKTSLSPDIDLINNIVEQTVNSMGQHVNYYVNTYNTLSADNIYGELHNALQRHDVLCVEGFYLFLQPCRFVMKKRREVSVIHIIHQSSVSGSLYAV